MSMRESLILVVSIFEVEVGLFSGGWVYVATILDSTTLSSMSHSTVLMFGIFSDTFEVESADGLLDDIFKLFF